MGVADPEGIGGANATEEVRRETQGRGKPLTAKKKNHGTLRNRSRRDDI